MKGRERRRVKVKGLLYRRSARVRERSRLLGERLADSPVGTCSSLQASTAQSLASSVAAGVREIYIKIKLYSDCDSAESNNKDYLIKVILY